MANTWDGSKWVDDSTGNYMIPKDKGGDGLWYSPNGQSVYNEATGEWYNKASGQVVPTGPKNNNNGAGSATASSGGPSPQGTNTPTTAGPSSTAFNIDPEWGFTYQANEFMQENEQNQLKAGSAREVANIGAQSSEAVARINAETQRQIADIDRATALEVARLNAQSQKDLQAGLIDSNQFMQQRELAAKETQFARQIALDQVIAENNFQIQQAQVSLGQGQLALQERQVGAQLAANPVDFVAYQNFKRSGANPQQGEPGIPAAASNEQIQGLASGLFNPNSKPGGYNPNLQGTGAFGAAIQSPNDLSRGEMLSLSPQEQGILTSFLKAGIDVNGTQVALDPEEYFQQVQNSWIPTVSGQQTGTQYR